MDWTIIALWFLCLYPIWGTFLWCFWEGSIRPRLIPRAEIVAEADELWAEDDEQAFEHACAEEHSAWYRSATFEQGKWKRVREEIMRRERSRGATFQKLG